MPTPLSLARRLSKSQAGLFRCIAARTAEGSDRSNGGWHYGPFHSRSARSLRRLGLVIDNPNRSRTETLLRRVQVGAKRIRVREDGSWHSDDFAPVYGDRYVEVCFDATTGQEIEASEADREEAVLTDLGREVLAALATLDD